MHAFIGLGSNLDHPSQRLISALRALQRLPGLTLCHHSRLYASAPVGPQDQPDYVNAVADIDTPSPPTPCCIPCRPWNWRRAGNACAIGANAPWIWTSC